MATSSETLLLTLEAVDEISGVVNEINDNFVKLNATLLDTTLDASGAANELDQLALAITGADGPLGTLTDDATAAAGELDKMGGAAFTASGDIDRAMADIVATLEADVPTIDASLSTLDDSFDAVIVSANEMTDGVRAAVSEMTDLVDDDLGDMDDVIRGSADNVKTALPEGFDLMSDDVKGTIDELGGILEDAFTAMDDQMDATGDVAKTAIPDGFGAAADDVKPVLDDLKVAVAAGLDAIEGEINDTADVARTSIAAGFDESTAPLTEAIEKVTAAAYEALIGHSTIDPINETADLAKTAIPEGFAQAAEDVTAPIDALTAKVTTGLDKLKADITSNVVSDNALLDEIGRTAGGKFGPNNIYQARSGQGSFANDQQIAQQEAAAQAEVDRLNKLETQGKGAAGTFTGPGIYSAKSDASIMAETKAAEEAAAAQAAAQLVAQEEQGAKMAAEIDKNLKLMADKGRRYTGVGNRSVNISKAEQEAAQRTLATQYLPNFGMMDKNAIIAEDFANAMPMLGMGTGMDQAVLTDAEKQLPPEFRDKLRIAMQNAARAEIPAIEAGLSREALGAAAEMPMLTQTAGYMPSFTQADIQNMTRAQMAKVMQQELSAERAAQAMSYLPGAYGVREVGGPGKISTAQYPVSYSPDQIKRAQAQMKAYEKQIADAKRQLAVDQKANDRMWAQQMRHQGKIPQAQLEMEANQAGFTGPTAVKDFQASKDLEMARAAGFSNVADYKRFLKIQAGLTGGGGGGGGGGRSTAAEGLAAGGAGGAAESGGGIGSLIKGAKPLLELFGLYEAGKWMYEGAKQFQSGVQQIRAGLDMAQPAAQKLGTRLLDLSYASDRSAQSGEGFVQAFGGVAGQLDQVYGKATVLKSLFGTKGLMTAADLGAGATQSNLVPYLQGLTAMMIAFKVPIGQAHSAMTVFTNVLLKTGLGISPLTTLFQRFGTRLADSGSSIKQVGGLLLELQHQGVTGQRGIYQATTAIQQLVSPTANSLEWLHRLGVEVYNSHDKYVGLASVLTQLSEKYDKLPNGISATVDAWKQTQLQAEEAAVAAKGEHISAEARVKMLNAVTTEIQNQLKVRGSAVQMALAARFAQQQLNVADENATLLARRGVDAEQLKAANLAVTAARYKVNALELTKLNFGTAVFGKNTTLMTHVLKDYASGGFSGLEKSIGKYSTVQNAANAYTQTFDYHWKRLLATVHTFLTTVGKTLLPWLTEVATKMINWTLATAKFVSKHKELLIAIAAIGAFVVLEKALIKVGELVDGVVSSIEKYSSVIGKVAGLNFDNMSTGAGKAKTAVADLINDVQTKLGTHFKNPFAQFATDASNAESSTKTSIAGIAGDLNGVGNKAGSGFVTSVSGGLGTAEKDVEKSGLKGDLTGLASGMGGSISGDVESGLAAAERDVAKSGLGSKLKNLLGNIGFGSRAEGEAAGSGLLPFLGIGKNANTAMEAFQKSPIMVAALGAAAAYAGVQIGLMFDKSRWGHGLDSLINGIDGTTKKMTALDKISAIQLPEGNTLNFKKWTQTWNDNTRQMEAALKGGLSIRPYIEEREALWTEAYEKMLHPKSFGKIQNELQPLVTQLESDQSLTLNQYKEKFQKIWESLLHPTLKKAAPNETKAAEIARSQAKVELTTARNALHDILGSSDYQSYSKEFSYLLSSWESTTGDYKPNNAVIDQMKARAISITQISDGVFNAIAADKKKIANLTHELSMPPITPEMGKNIVKSVDDAINQNARLGYEGWKAFGKKSATNVSESFGTWLKFNEPMRTATMSAQAEFDKLMGIGSPSEWMLKRGRWTMEGFANGISSGKDLPIQALKDAMSKIWAPIQTTLGINISGATGAAHSTTTILHNDLLTLRETVAEYVSNTTKAVGHNEITLNQINRELSSVANSVERNLDSVDNRINVTNALLTRIVHNTEPHNSAPEVHINFAGAKFFSKTDMTRLSKSLSDEIFGHQLPSAGHRFQQR